MRLLIPILLFCSVTANAGNCNFSATLLKSTIKQSKLNDRYTVIARIRNDSTCAAALSAKVTFWDCDQTECFKLIRYPLPLVKNLDPYFYTEIGEVTQVSEGYSRSLFRNLMGELQYSVEDPTATTKKASDERSDEVLRRMIESVKAK